MAEWYVRHDHLTISTLMTCAQMTDLPLKDGPVIEVACGPGLHSETLAKSFLKGNASVLVSCDFSSEMVSKMKERYSTSDFTKIEGNKVVMNTEIDYASLKVNERVDMDKIITENGSFQKLVYGCVADNMRLPFADNIFEAYLSSHSLMIVEHRELMIAEAFRVLKPGSRACFAIWGSESHS